jgi:hypothetical protein
LVTKTGVRDLLKGLLNGLFISEQGLLLLRLGDPDLSAKPPDSENGLDDTGESNISGDFFDRLADIESYCQTIA